MHGANQVEQLRYQRNHRHCLEGHQEQTQTLYESKRGISQIGGASAKDKEKVMIYYSAIIVNKKSKHIFMIIGLLWTQPLLRVSLQALTDEIFGLVWNSIVFRTIIGKVDLITLQDLPWMNELILADSVPKGSPSIEHFIEDDSDRPDIDFAWNFGIILLVHFWRQIVEGACFGRGEIYAWIFSLYDLADSKVYDLNDTIMEEYVSRFEVVMDDGLLLVVEVLDCKDDLFYYLLSLSFIQTHLFFQVAP